MERTFSVTKSSLPSELHVSRAFVVAATKETRVWRKPRARSRNRHLRGLHALVSLPIWASLGSCAICSIVGLLGCSPFLSYRWCQAVGVERFLVADRVRVYCGCGGSVSCSYEACLRCEEG